MTVLRRGVALVICGPFLALPPLRRAFWDSPAQQASDKKGTT